MPAAANVAVVAALVLVLGQLTPAAASGVCGSDPNRVSPSGNGSDCVCDGGYESGCAGDDPAASFSDGSNSGNCTEFEANPEAGGLFVGTCVAKGACTICCATCADECAAAGVSTGNCTACEAGERRRARGAHGRHDTSPHAPFLLDLARALSLYPAVASGTLLPPCDVDAHAHTYVIWCSAYGAGAL